MNAGELGFLVDQCGESRQEGVILYRREELLKAALRAKNPHANSVAVGSGKYRLNYNIQTGGLEIMPRKEENRET